MRQIGRWYILHRRELEFRLRRQGHEQRARLVTQDLLRACMAADAFVHESHDHPEHEAHRRAVCDLLVDAISQAQRP